MTIIMTPMDGFTFGADPELFVTDRNGRFVSAEGLLPGTKAEPYKVRGGAVQVDGMAAEFNIDPSSTFQAFNKNINAVLGTLKSMLPEGYGLSGVPSVVFDEDVWDASPDIAKELGCTPDYNAWTGEVNPPPSLPDNPRLRTASGHIHIGWTEDAEPDDLEHLTNCQDLVKQLDWYVGGWSLQKDPDPTRRQLYGKAGACRYKPYGVEYRVLSNFWVLREAMRLEVWNRANKAILDMRKIFMPEKAMRHNDLLVEMINSSERNSALVRTWEYPLGTIYR